MFLCHSRESQICNKVISSFPSLLKSNTRNISSKLIKRRYQLQLHWLSSSSSFAAQHKIEMFTLPRLTARLELFLFFIVDIILKSQTFGRRNFVSPTSPPPLQCEIVIITLKANSLSLSLSYSTFVFLFPDI